MLQCKTDCRSRSSGTSLEAKEWLMKKEGAFNRKEISWPRVQPECVPPRSGTQIVSDSQVESNPARLIRYYSL